METTQKMNKYPWFTQSSFKQRMWLSATVVAMLSIIMLAAVLDSSREPEETIDFTTDMSITDIAPHLGVTGKALARELNLPLDVSKRTPVKALGITPEELQHAAEHLLSHRDTMLKYYVYAALEAIS